MTASAKEEVSPLIALQNKIELTDEAVEKRGKRSCEYHFGSIGQGRCEYGKGGRGFEPWSCWIHVFGLCKSTHAY